MASLRTAVLATAMLSAGLVSVTGTATAAEGSGTPGHSRAADTDSRDSGTTYQHGVVNSTGVTPNVNPATCNNNVPANVGGVQVPLQDVAGSVPLSHSSEGADPGLGKSCTNPAAAG